MCQSFYIYFSVDQFSMDSVFHKQHKVVHKVVDHVLLIRVCSQIST